MLHPLASAKPARYQRYDWNTDQLAEWYEVDPSRLVIIEGIYCTRSELAHYYMFRVWVQASRSVRLVREIERDGETRASKWTGLWMPAEDRYVQLDDPQRRADLLLDGTSTIPHDLKTQYVRITQAHESAAKE